MERFAIKISFDPVLNICNKMKHLDCMSFFRYFSQWKFSASESKEIPFNSPTFPFIIFRKTTVQTVLQDKHSTWIPLPCPLNLFPYVDTCCVLKLHCLRSKVRISLFGSCTDMSAGRMQCKIYFIGQWYFLSQLCLEGRWGIYANQG